MFVNPVATFVLMGTSQSNSVSFLYSNADNLPRSPIARLVRTCEERERHVSLWYRKVLKLDQVCNHSAGRLNIECSCVDMYTFTFVSLVEASALVSCNWI